MLKKILKSNKDKMSAILLVHRVKSSEGDRPSKYEQTHKLMLIWSNVPKKAITEDLKSSYCLSTKSEPYTLQKRPNSNL